jgi:small subunit ribosomal protein S17
MEASAESAALAEDSAVDETPAVTEESVSAVAAAPAEEAADEPAAVEAQPAETAQAPAEAAPAEEAPKKTRKAAAPKAAKAKTKTPAPVAEVKKSHGKRAEKIGIISSDKMMKTVTVRVDRLVKHPVYRKYVKKRKKFMAHDDLGAKIGDKVKIIETRPLSARKRWRVVEIIQKAQS